MWWHESFLLFFETGFLCSFEACPGALSVDQASLEFRALSTSASQVLGIKACTTTDLALSRIF